MSISPKDAQQALTVIQMGQMASTLLALIMQAVQSGREAVTPDELATAFAEKDAALVELNAAIARAKEEGR